MFYQYSVICVIITIFIASHFDNFVDSSPNTGSTINEYCKNVEFNKCHNPEVNEKCPNRCAIVVALLTESKEKGYNSSTPRHQDRARAKKEDINIGESNLIDAGWCKHVDLQDCLKPKVKKACPGVCISDTPIDAYWCEHTVDWDDCLQTEVRKACPITCMQKIDKEWCQWVVNDLDDCEKPDIQEDCPAQCRNLGMSSPIAEDEPWCQWTVQLPECDNEKIMKSCPILCSNAEPSRLNDEVLPVKVSSISPGNECGKIQDNHRIVGGQNAAVNEYPWIVGFFRKYVFHCGGSLINKDWILTASHCFRHGAVSDFLVTVGDHDLRTDDEINHVLRNLSVVITHQRFDTPIPYTCDIALAKMIKPVTFNDKVAPICLPNPDIDYDDVEATIIGWGAMKSGHPGASILQETTVSTMSSAKCRRSRTRNWLYRIARDDWVCAVRKEGGKDACQGDSGGPMMAVEDHHWVQIGITSWGNGCALKGNPGVYTRVSSFIDWIKTNTNESTRCTFDSEAVCHELIPN